MKRVLFASVAVVAAFPAFAADSGSGSTNVPDVSKIVQSIDFSSWVIPALVSVTAAMMGVRVARVGLKMISGMVSSR